MKIKNILFIIAALLLFGNSLYSQGYSIKLKAPDFAGQEVILAEYFTSRMVPKDTALLDANGQAVFQGEKAFEGGMYILFFNPKYYFDFLIDRDQDFSVSVDSSDLVNKTIFSGSDENIQFYLYKSFLEQKRNIQEKYIEELASATSASDSSKIKEKLDDLTKEIEREVNKMIDDNAGSFFSTFLLAMKENNAPDDLLKGSKREQDSIRYVYFKDHYFNNFNISDIRLLHTPIYEPKIKTYINKVVPQQPDSLMHAIDMLMEKSRANEAIFRYMLITLFNNFAESKLMGMDRIYFYIAEKYYIPEASWSSEEFINNLKENLEKSKATFIGEIAPDFELRGIPKEHFLMAEMDTTIKNDPHVGYTFRLSDIDAKYTLLYFWEADCGHCQKATPKLYEVFEKYKDKNVKVLAVHVINSVEGKIKWIDFVNEHGLYDWINCWSPYNNDFRKQYNLLSFPQLFLLDENKKIVAKTLSPEQVDDILGRFLE